MKRLHLKLNTETDKGDRLAVKARNCFLGSDKHFMSYGSDLKLNLTVMHNNFCFKFCLWQEEVDKNNSVPGLVLIQYGDFFNDETKARLSKPYQLQSHRRTLA